MNRADALAGCAAVPAAFAFATRAGAQELATVRILAPPIDPGSQAFYARDQGFFKKVGINGEVTTQQTGAAVAAAVAGGAADIGQSNLTSIASAHERGIPFVAIAGANRFDWHQHQNVLAVAPNSPIKTAHDLIGKTVALPGVKNITEVALDAWLEQRGVTPNSVKAIELPMSSMSEAVNSGRIDAAEMTYPELADALEKKSVRVIGYPFEAIAKEFLAGVWFTTAAWAKAHPDLVRAYASAMAMSADWANKNPDRSAKILERVTGVPLNPASPRILFARTLDPRQMQSVIDMSAKYGLLKASFPATDLIYRAS
jgi:NitT/TauT family transport system substrate-binding protein